MRLEKIYNGLVIYLEMQMKVNKDESKICM